MRCAQSSNGGPVCQLALEIAASGWQSSGFSHTFVPVLQSVDAALSPLASLSAIGPTPKAPTMLTAKAAAPAAAATAAAVRWRQKFPE